MNPFLIVFQIIPLSATARLSAARNMANIYDVANWQIDPALLTSTKSALCDLFFKHVGEAAACVQFGQPSVDELKP